MISARALHATPFAPFRIHLADGRSFDVREPGNVFVTAFQIVIGLDIVDGLPSRSVLLAPAGVVHIEPLTNEPRIDAVLETAIYADDLAAAEAFYAGVLGLAVITRAAGRHVFFRCGPGVFLVFNATATLAGGELPAHGTRGPSHVAFTLDPAQRDAWRDRLIAHGVEIEHEHAWPGGGRSLYFRDPAGNSVELATRAVWDG